MKTSNHIPSQFCDVCDLPIFSAKREGSLECKFFSLHLTERDFDVGRLDVPVITDVVSTVRQDELAASKNLSTPRLRIFHRSEGVNISLTTGSTPNLRIFLRCE